MDDRTSAGHVVPVSFALPLSTMAHLVGTSVPRGAVSRVAVVFSSRCNVRLPTLGRVFHTVQKMVLLEVASV